MHSLGLMAPEGWIALDRAAVFADGALSAALRMSLQPFEHADARRNGQRRSEGTHVATGEALDEQACDQQRDGVEDERPCADELQRDRGLERLHLGADEGEIYRVQRNREQPDEDEILQRPEPLVRSERQA